MPAKTLDQMNDMRLAIISCAGELPKRLRDQCIKDNIEHFIIAIKGICDPDLTAQADEVFPIGHFATAVKRLQQLQITHIVMAGHLVRPSLLDMRFDLSTLNLLRKHRNVLIGGDDTVLSRISNYFEEVGFQVLGVTDIDPSLFAQQGLIAGPKPSQQVLEDIECGKNIYHQIASADIGQSFIMHQGSVLAVEAREGTDLMIERIAELKEKGRIRGRGKIGVLMKYQKPNQDMRLDTPVIGLKTVENAVAAGLSTIVISAGNVIVMQYDDIIRYCNAQSITLIGVDFA